MEARNALHLTIQEGLQAPPDFQALAIQALIEARFIVISRTEEPALR